MSKKLRILCRFQTTLDKKTRAVYPIPLGLDGTTNYFCSVEMTCEEYVRNNRPITAGNLSYWIEIHIIDKLVAAYQIKNSKWDFFLSDADRAIAVKNIKQYFITKYNVPLPLKQRKNKYR